jgi:hypothetical protein
LKKIAYAADLENSDTIFLKQLSRFSQPLDTD